MSGFEIAGIVLGAIPLFISAAEHYRDGLGIIDKIVKKKRILKAYIEELKTIQTVLGLRLREVIGNTDLSARTQKELVENVTSDLWRQQDVQGQLRRSLGDTADTFLKTMKRMADIFVEQIEGDNTLPGHEQYKLEKGLSLRIIITQFQGSKTAWHKSFYKRVKFTWKSPKRNEILIELRGCNDDLSILISGVQATRPYQMKQEVRKVHAAWHSRVESQRLFDVLTSYCTCSCQTPHLMKLRIKPHTIDDDECADHVCMYFDISFQRTVDCERAMTVAMYRNSMQRGRTSHDTTGWTSINDLCSAVEPINNASEHVTLAIDEARALWDTQSSADATTPAAKPGLSLESLFPMFSPFANKIWLIREKRILSIILAYSMVQHLDSCWLQSGLYSNQILFSEDGVHFGASTAGNALRRPYISTNVVSPPLATAPPPHRSTYLLSLGIILLELHLNQSIQSHRPGLPLLPGEAFQILTDHADDHSMSQCYYEAIRFCICPKPSETKRVIDFSDQGFREIYYREVILPLEQELYENYDVDQKFWDML